MHMPKAGDAVAVFEGGRRIYTTNRTQRRPIVRQRYDKSPQLATNGKRARVSYARPGNLMVQGFRKNWKRKAGAMKKEAAIKDEEDEEDEEDEADEATAKRKAMKTLNLGMPSKKGIGLRTRAQLVLHNPRLVLRSRNIPRELRAVAEIYTVFAN